MTESVEPPRVSDLTLNNAPLGAVHAVAADREVPPDWHVCDGEEVESSRYPDFAADRQITGKTFTVPAPMRGPSGTKYIIKLGEPVEVVEPAETPGTSAAGSLDEIMAAHRARIEGDL